MFPVGMIHPIYYVSANNVQTIHNLGYDTNLNSR